MAMRAMKLPIIEVSQRSVCVSPDFDGVLTDGMMRTRHNLIGNRTRFVIDSNGDLWSFAFAGTNHTGIRRWVSVFWNLSEDRYAYTVEEGIPIGRFREILRPYESNENPDTEDLATALLDAIAACGATDPLRRHVRSLNL
jgi:hypothetical protein